MPVCDQFGKGGEVGQVDGNLAFEAMIGSVILSVNLRFLLGRDRPTENVILGSRSQFGHWKGMGFGVEPLFGSPQRPFRFFWLVMSR